MTDIRIQPAGPRDQAIHKEQYEELRAALFDEEMQASVLSRVRIEVALRVALAEEDEIYVAFAKPLAPDMFAALLQDHPNWLPGAQSERSSCWPECA
jgi:hypothetical protein